MIELYGLKDLFIQNEVFIHAAMHTGHFETTFSENIVWKIINVIDTINDNRCQSNKQYFGISSAHKAKEWCVHKGDYQCLHT